jgi:hypothetical protein
MECAFKIINENMNLKKLAEQMGTSVNMIDKHYGHLDWDAYGSAGCLLIKHIGSKFRIRGR